MTTFLHFSDSCKNSQEYLFLAGDLKEIPVLIKSILGYIKMISYLILDMVTIQTGIFKL